MAGVDDFYRETLDLLLEFLDEDELDGIYQEDFNIAVAEVDIQNTVFK